MVSEWVTPNVPKRIYQVLDDYAKSLEGQDLGYTSGKDIMVELMRQFVRTHKDSQKEQEGKITFLTTTDNKIILEDSLKGPVIVEIDKDKKLQCYPCLDDPHNNRYVTFVSEQKELWPFLKKQGVKYLIVRDDENDKKIKI